MLHSPLKAALHTVAKPLAARYNPTIRLWIMLMRTTIQAQFIRKSVFEKAYGINLAWS
jgi:hypothetical protein